MPGFDGTGPSGECICPNCGARIPRYNLGCLKCGAKMVRG